MLRMQEMAFPGFKFQKFSGGACPLTPLEFVVPPNFRIMLQSDFKLDPPLIRDRSLLIPGLGLIPKKSEKHCKFFIYTQSLGSAMGFWVYRI